MKKLTIVFNDNSKVVYTMKDYVDYKPYFERHSLLSMKSAILQQYPKKDNQSIELIETKNYMADILKKYGRS